MEVNIKPRPYRKEVFGQCTESGTKTVTYRKYKPRRLYDQGDKRQFKVNPACY